MKNEPRVHSQGSGILSNERGFSLIETMVAVGILAVGLLGAASMLQFSMSNDRYNVRQRTVYHAATGKIEELKAQGLDYIVSKAIKVKGTKYTEYQNNKGEWSDIEPTECWMTREYTINDGPYPPDPPYRVVVSVRWGARKYSPSKWELKHDYTMESIGK